MNKYKVAIFKNGNGSTKRRNKMRLDEIVLKLNGNIGATGCHSTDMDRLENLKSLTETIDLLLMAVSDQSRYKDRQESSIKAIGVYASKYIDSLKDWSEDE